MQKQDERIARLAEIRGETPEAVLARFSAEELARLPKSFSRHILAMYDLPVAASGVEDGLPFVRLENGRVFYGHMPAPNHRRQFGFVRDLLPTAIVEDAFLAALDVAVRYVRMDPWPPDALLPPKDGLIVECGAYLGHKSIAFADDLVPQGRVVAIEMIPENLEILRRNVAANGLDDRIRIVPCGVWDEDTTLRIYSRGWQKNSLVDTNRLDTSAVEVPVRRLESILDESGLAGTPIDLLYVTVNGAEHEVLQGLGKSWTDLQAAFVVAKYEVEGENKAALCSELLAAKDLAILEEPSPQFVSARRTAERAVVRDRKWFDCGDRHGLENRISDLAPLLDSRDLSGLHAADIGAAEGDIALWLAERFASVTAMEPSDYGFERLEKRAAEYRGITPLKADIRDYDFADPIDAVFFLGVLHYFHDDDLKREVLTKCVASSRHIAFVRTGVREWRDKLYGPGKNSVKFTPADTFRSVAADLGRELFLIDNTWRGDGDTRLGDLALFVGKSDGNPFADIGQRVSDLRLANA